MHKQKALPVAIISISLYYERVGSIESAITREKQLKGLVVEMATEQCRSGITTSARADS